MRQLHRHLLAGVLAAGSLLAALAAVGLANPAAAAPPARAERQMVVAANPLAAEAGREILRAGGSAVDAAIATELVLNLVEPQSSGIGGGAFLLHFDGQSGAVAASAAPTPIERSQIRRRGGRGS